MGSATKCLVRRSTSMLAYRAVPNIRLIFASVLNNGPYSEARPSKNSYTAHELYCNRSCVWVGVSVCVCLGLLPR